MTSPQCPLPCTPSVLVNASNLHVGGGVGVAASCIDALSRTVSPADRVFLLLSSTVHANLLALGTNLGRFAGCEVYDAFGLASLWRGLGRRLAGYDVVFTVFGPAYVWRKKGAHLCGFAQPLIIYPKNPMTHAKPWYARWLQYAKYSLQELFFRRADALVVELDHVRRALMRRPLMRNKAVHIVNNTADRIFLEPLRWATVTLPSTSSDAVKLGIVTRNYPHKNLAVLPALKRELLKTHGLVAEFFVTFNAAEWQAAGADFREAVHNAGTLVLAQVPSFYIAMDGVIFPSLLECFSATPLEAMTVGRPLFASDLPFIREVCAEHAQYFDPSDVASMAAALAHWFRDVAPAERQARTNAAQRFARNWPDAAARADAYLRLSRSLAPISAAAIDTTTPDGASTASRPQ